MILLDANILIYSYDSGSSQHTKARAWVEKTFSGLESVGLSWRTVVCIPASHDQYSIAGPARR